MIKEWGFIYRPDYTATQFRATILIGYPFDFSSPTPPVPTPPVSSGVLFDSNEINYFKSYLGERQTGLTVVPDYQPRRYPIDENITYFKKYLGEN